MGKLLGMGTGSWAPEPLRPVVKQSGCIPGHSGGVGMGRRWEQGVFSLFFGVCMIDVGCRPPPVRLPVDSMMADSKYCVPAMICRRLDSMHAVAEGGFTSGYDRCFL